MRSITAIAFLILTILLGAWAWGTEETTTTTTSAPMRTGDRQLSDAEIENLDRRWNDEDNRELKAEEQPRRKRSLEDVGETNDNPEATQKEADKDKGVMLFVRVVKKNGQQPAQIFTERVALRWQVMLQNNHIIAMPFITEPDLVIFLIQDGTRGAEAREQIQKQSECKYTQLKTEIRYGAGWRQDHGVLRVHEEL